MRRHPWPNPRSTELAVTARRPGSAQARHSPEVCKGQGSQLPSHLVARGTVAILTRKSAKSSKLDPHKESCTPIKCHTLHQCIAKATVQHLGHRWRHWLGKTELWSLTEQLSLKAVRRDKFHRGVKSNVILCLLFLSSSLSFKWWEKHLTDAFYMQTCTHFCLHKQQQMCTLWRHHLYFIISEWKCFPQTDKYTLEDLELRTYKWGLLHTQCGHKNNKSKLFNAHV